MRSVRNRRRAQARWNGRIWELLMRHVYAASVEPLGLDEEPQWMDGTYTAFRGTIEVNEKPVVFYQMDTGERKLSARSLFTVLGFSQAEIERWLDEQRSDKEEPR